MPDVFSILADRFHEAIAAAFGAEHARADPLIRASGNEQFGDYQANLAMSLAKSLASKPRDVAEKIVEHLQWRDVCAEAPTIAGPGFINLKLKSEFLGEQVRAMAGDDKLSLDSVTPQTVVVDYSGPNVAKEMHVGHLRSTIIGDCIARVLVFQGHNVIRQNHLGDWGTQFGMLIEHMIDTRFDPAHGHQISDLNALYQQSKQKFDADTAFAERSRQRVVMLQSGDADTLKLWHALIDESKRHFNDIYRRLNVKLTDADVRAESFYNPRLESVVHDLDKAGLLRIDDGASVVYPEGFKDREGQPLGMIVRKSDGGFLYATTDLAAARFRIEHLHAQRIIYVTDARQSQHFAMVFATLHAAGWADENVRFEHVPFGTMLGKDKKPFKTRSGEVVKLTDLIDEAMQRARQVLEEKNPQLAAEQREQVAQVVGIGAMKYADLSSDRIKDYVFDWDRMLAMDGNTAPYLINAYVRIQSIFRKAKAQHLSMPGPDVSIAITEPAERSLSVKLLQFPSTIQSVASSLEPHRLCTYLYELATAYHRFYENCPVLTAPNDMVRESRLQLSALTARTLRSGLDLLGIETVEQM